MSDYRDRWQAWHERRLATLTSDYGYLAIVSLDWLADGETIEVAGVPGQWSSKGGSVTYVPDADSPLEAVSIDGAVPHEATAVVGVYEIGSLTEPRTPSQLWQGQRRIELAVRGDQHIIRVRDPKSTIRAEFAGIEYFEPDERWVVPVRFEPYEEHTEVQLGAIVDVIEHQREALGRFWFEIDGQELSLEYLRGSSDVPAILFRDATAGIETYPAVRMIYIDQTDPFQITALDFNTAITPPCAYSPYCTCPLPPASNILPVPIRAGEKYTGEQTGDQQ